MAKNKRPSRDDISLMVAAAQLCFNKGKTQEEVGEILGVSRPKVSRLLSQAREHGIIEITIRNPIVNKSMVQADLIEQFGLDDAVITPYTVDQQDVIVPQIAAAAAEYLSDNLPDRAVLGLGRGYAMYEMVKSLKPRKAQRPTTLPLSGGVGGIDAGNPFDEILNVAAAALGGEAKFLYAPALLASEKFRDSVLAEPRSQEIARLWDEMDWVVVGIGTIPPMRGVVNPYFDRSLDAFVKETGVKPVAEVSLRFILPDGRIPDTSRQQCLVAATPKQIRKAKVRMAVAGGLAKLPAIYASLLTGMFNVLVTDEHTAEELVKLKTGNKPGQQ